MKQSCLCVEMKQLWKEQQSLAEFGKGCRFIHPSDPKDTIPFMLLTRDHSTAFTAISNGIATPYFRLEKIYEGSCIVQLSLLQPTDLTGWPALTAEDLFALRKTNQCIILKLCTFSSINPLPYELVGRPLPIIESKN